MALARQARSVMRSLHLSSSYSSRNNLVYDSRYSVRGERSFSMHVKAPPQMRQGFKNAYAIAQLRKLTGYSKSKFYQEAIQLYKEINSLLAQGDKTSLRKLVTENMYSIGIDKNNLDNSFVQLALEILTNQKFAAYDLQKNVVAGNMDAMVLVRDIWVFERALIQPGAKWRLCGRISL